MAAANRVRFGRTKAEKERAQSERNRDRSELDRKRLEGDAASDDPPQGG